MKAKASFSRNRNSRLPDHARFGEVDRGGAVGYLAVYKPDSSDSLLAGGLVVAGLLLLCLLRFPMAGYPSVFFGALAGPLRRVCLLDLGMSISSRES